jgi:hypothetical protein
MFRTNSSTSLASSTSARGTRRPALIARLQLLAGLAVAAGFGAAPDVATAQSTTVGAVQKGRCQSGYELRIENGANPPYAFCRRITTQTVRQYTNYQPCLPPGAYVSSDESPGGALPSGHDRCTVGGVVSGPGLPCPPSHAQREIRSGQVDRCYRNVTQTNPPQFTNVVLFQ